jgi:hypothetical protein
LQPRTRSWLAGTAIALCAIAMTLMARPASAEIAYSVSETNKLVRFDTNEPGQTIVGTISGMIGGEQILSIDFRPITDRLYGVSANRLYTIDPATAQAQPVGVAAFTVPLAGNADMDFDPVSGMIRVVTDTNQNVRINPETGVDTADTPISGVIGISAIAFRKNIAPAERSTLLAISPATNVFARIGEVDLTDGGASQAAGVATATQALGFDVDGPAGFDITANSERFFAVLTRAGETESGLYTDTFQGGASLLRGVPVGERLRGLAVLSRQVTLHLLAQPGNRIVSVLSSPTATIIPITRDTPIAGLHPFEAMTQIATRPATGELVGLTTTGRLLNIDPRTGQTTFLSQLSVAVSAKVFTFHPATDRLRIIQASRENFSVDPDTGVVTAEAIIDRPTVESGAYALDGTLYVRSQGEFHRLTDPSTGVSTPMPDGAAHETDFSGLAFGPDGVGYHVYSPPGSAFSHLRPPISPTSNRRSSSWMVKPRRRSSCRS